nr:flagellar assembly protein FliW [Lachnospiraceae bacterium]
NDSEKENSPIKWFQSIEEPQFAMPVIDPLLVKADFNPEVDNDRVSLIGEWESEDILVLVTITVPHDIEKMTVNLKGPFIINTKTMKAVQTIIEDDDYDIKFPIYGILKKMKEEAGK